MSSKELAGRRLEAVLVSRDCAATLGVMLNEIVRQLGAAAEQRVHFSVRLILDQPLDEAYRAVFAAAAASGLPLRYRVAENIGPPAARNVLIRWLLDEPPDAFHFLDDDEVPAEGWLGLLLQLWQRYPGDILTGPLLARSAHQSFLLRHGAFGRLRALKSGEVAPDAYIHNTLVPIAVARRLGPSFDTRLTICTGSDAAWFRSAAQAGFTIRYFPELVVYEMLTREQQRLGLVVCRWIFNGRAGAIAGRLRRPGLPGLLRLAGYNAAKGAYGLLSFLGYALVLSPARSLRGLRVAMSATGGLLGLFSALPGEYQGTAQTEQSGARR
jgi:glycosyltransferase involved in cell wall biosynthesis